jgi:ribosomal protein S18 acetylase RimI-like enzyme
MNILIRKSQPCDLQQVYELSKKCFLYPLGESEIMSYLDNSFVIEIKDSSNIIGVLLQGIVITRNHDLINTLDSNYKPDAFTLINSEHKLFLENNIYFNKIYGIVMLCIDENFRSRGLAQKLIEKHWQDNLNTFSCLNTRVSNSNAYNLYKKLGYQDIAIIKNNYFHEDSIFMVKFLTFT